MVHLDLAPDVDWHLFKPINDTGTKIPKRDIVPDQDIYSPEQGGVCLGVFVGVREAMASVRILIKMKGV